MTINVQSAFPRVVAAGMLLIAGLGHAQICPNPSASVANSISQNCVSPYDGRCAHTLTRSITINWNRVPYANGHYRQVVSGQIGKYQGLAAVCQPYDVYQECSYYAYPVTTDPGAFAAEGYDAKATAAGATVCYSSGLAVPYVPYVSCNRGTNRTVRDSIGCPRSCEGTLEDRAVCRAGGGVWDSTLCECVDPSSPIVVDLGDGFRFTNYEGGVAFDLNSDGQAEQISWTAAGANAGFLALDRNGNGTVDNGSELFGNFTPQQPSETPNGFLALAEYDKPENGGNGDGIIDARDAVSANLRVWIDMNHDGICQPAELRALDEAGISAIDLEYHESQREDQYGNMFRYRAKVYGSRHRDFGRWAYDIFLLSAP